VRKAVGQVPGVNSVVASHAAETIDVDFSSDPDDEAVRTAVEDAGFAYVRRR
jgi:copper chaperone CopZ